MATTQAEREILFDSKAKALTAALEDWYEEETEAIDAGIVSGAPTGTGGSIVANVPAIDSKRVLDASSVTKDVLDIEIPPEIIKPGGYDSCEEMLSDMLPKLRDVFSGKLKVKKRKQKKEMAEA